MFNGPEEAVTLRFSDKLLNPVYDKFGEHTRMKRLGADTLEATVNVRIAPTFFGWLFQFGTEMEIVSPESLKEEYKKRAESVLQKIKDKHACTIIDEAQRAAYNSVKPNTFYRRVKSLGI